MSEEPFLILHKVRGAPAFDIAICCTEEDGWGTYSDPAPWWIIPTSGHRAYPYWHMDLYEFVNTMDGMPYAPMPDDIPDHYSCQPGGHSPKRTSLDEDASELLASLGLRKAPKPILRRV